jgi:serine/threonine protein kinase
MDFVDGQDVAAKTQTGAAAISEAVKISMRVANAIEYAHEQGVIHCDLKPSNVLLGGAECVVVTDFGLAQLITSVKSGIIGLGGTPSFMAPEQLDANPATLCPAIDIYGIGGILYVLLTGHAPVVSVPAKMSTRISAKSWPAGIG